MNNTLSDWQLFGLQLSWNNFIYEFVNIFDYCMLVCVATAIVNETRKSFNYVYFEFLYLIDDNLIILQIVFIATKYVLRYILCNISFDTKDCY